MESKKNQSMQPTLSKEMLGQFIGKKVAHLVRFSWWKNEEVSLECNISNEQAFSLTAGPLAVIFEDGSTLGVASDPSINSVTVWLDRVVAQGNVTQTLNEDPELFPIKASDGTYAEPFWKEFAARTVVGFSILKSKEMSAAENELPSELGLCFHFDNNERFIAAHGLHDGSDDFSVLADNQIDPSIREKLEELPLL